MDSQRELDDVRMEIVMGRLLQAGVLLAAAIVLAGGVLYVVKHAGEMSSYRVFVARPMGLLQAGAMLDGIRHGEASAILQLGILVLVATPICRVVFAFVAFALERDGLYVVVSLIVLAVLLLGMFRGG